MRSVASKWTKTEVLKQVHGVAHHLPPMRLYSSSQLAQMLRQYGRVVAKPVVGSGGSGLLFIERRRGTYYMKHRRKVKVFTSFQGLVRSINRVRRGRRYMLQQWISLAEINGRPVDYRLKLVKESGNWRVKALVGRLASKGLATTNICRGGTQMQGRVAMRRSLPSVAASAKRKEMRRLAFLCTEKLEKTFPGIGSLGFDFGLDRSGRIWIFEVNTKPS